VSLQNLNLFFNHRDLSALHLSALHKRRDKAGALAAFSYLQLHPLTTPFAISRKAICVASPGVDTSYF
jgi:hypothetical protein